MFNQNRQLVPKLFLRFQKYFNILGNHSRKELQGWSFYRFLLLYIREKFEYWLDVRNTKSGTDFFKEENSSSDWLMGGVVQL